MREGRAGTWASKGKHWAAAWQARGGLLKGLDGRAGARWEVGMRPLPLGPESVRLSLSSRFQASEAYALFSDTSREGKAIAARQARSKPAAPPLPQELEASCSSHDTLCSGTSAS